MLINLYANFFIMGKDYYKILGISKNATTDEIKKAYRKLALQYHPDRGGDKESEAKFKETSEAYQILSDPQKRKSYDQFGDAAFKNGGAGYGGQGFGGFEGFDFSGFNRSSRGSASGFGGLGDIFEDFFGQSLSQVQAELRVSPAQAVLGDKIDVEVNGEKISFNIPAGTQSGTSFRFPGKGGAYKGGRGDLIITISVELPKHLTKEQREAWEKVRNAENQKKWWR